MVKLYGVVSGCKISSLWESTELRLVPGESLLSSLAALPLRSRVGVEFHNEHDRNLLQDDFARKLLGAGLGMGEGRAPVSDGYWEHLIRACDGHQIVFLENADLWLRFNTALVSFVKNRKRDIFYHQGESEEKYHRRLVQHNERNHKKHVEVRRLHEIERNTALLRAASENNVDAVVVSLGHSDYWWVHRDEIAKNFGFVFDAYATEMYKVEGGFAFQEFHSLAFADPELVYERTCVERTVRVAEGKRLSDKVPDWIGTWDVMEPSRGYFEMFGENENMATGRIEDCFGNARFTRVVDSLDADFTFVKEYIPGNCVTNAIHKPIHYQGSMKDGRVAGYFSVAGSGMAFYMTQNLKETPLEMSVHWNALVSRKK